MYTSEQIAQALKFDSDPSVEDSRQKWADEVIAWGDQHLTEGEWQRIERIVFGATLTDVYN